jgi:mono/diheme cytochrome c family protein
MSTTFFEKVTLGLSFLFLCGSVFADDKMTLGLEIFNNKAQCGVCHTLQAAGSDGQIGPSLDLLKPQLEQVVSAVTNGIGVMQAFEETLTTEEIEAVAHYVFNSTNN